MDVDGLRDGGGVGAGRERFEALTGYLNPPDLAAEELDTETGSYLGNYPQAFSHIELINSALYAGFAAGREIPEPAPMGVRLGDPNVTHDG